MKIFESLFYKNLLASVALLVVLSVFISCDCKKTCEDDEIFKSNVVHPEWSKDANIYEVNIRQYTPEGTFAAFEEHLPRLKEMGVDILWLMPIFPISVEKRKGTLGSYYAVQDYKDVNPEYGNMDDFKNLVNRAHELGFKVILDWVANHTGAGNILTVEHPEWYKKDSLANFISPYDWTDVLQLDYDNPEMREYMIGALKFWIEEADVDGYRCDVAFMVPTDFWEEARKQLDQIKPVFMLAESEKPELLVNAFDMDYAWEFHHITNEIAKGNMDATAFDTYFLKADTVYPKGGIRMYFTSNHDENSWNGTVFERMGDGAKAFAVLTFGIKGMPLLYSGQETGLDKRLEFFEKDTIIWDDNSEFHDFYKTLIKIKKDNPALWFDGELNPISNSKPDAIYAFSRKRDHNNILICINFTNSLQDFTITDAAVSGSYEDLITGESLKIKKSESISLNPWDYMILKKKK